MAERPAKRARGEMETATFMTALANTGSPTEARAVTQAAAALTYVVRNMKVDSLVKEVKDSVPEAASLSNDDIAELIAIERTVQAIADEDIGGFPTVGGRRRMKGGAVGDSLKSLAIAISRVPIQGVNFMIENIEQKLEDVTKEIIEMPDEKAAGYMKSALKKGLIAAAMFDLRNGKSGFIGSVISAVLLVVEKCSPSVMSSIMSLAGYKEIVDAIGSTAVTVAPGLIATYVATKIVMSSLSTAQEAFDPKNRDQVKELIRQTILKITRGKIDIAAGAGAAAAAEVSLGNRIASKFRIEDAIDEAVGFVADDFMQDPAKMRARAERFGIPWQEDVEPAGVAGIGGRRRRHRKTKKHGGRRKPRSTKKRHTRRH